jgi:glucose-6-phosphate isomerase
MANIVSGAFESEYGAYEALHGAAFYEMKSRALVKNPHYPHAPSIRYIGATCGRGTHRFCKGPIYDMVGNEDACAFLNYPERYAAVLAVLLKG